MFSSINEGEEGDKTISSFAADILYDGQQAVSLLYLGFSKGKCG